MTSSDFQQFWSTVAATVPPASYLFKWKFPERWFRIHSLPESKRYAETLAEWQHLLHRQYTVLEDLLGSEASLLLITGYYTHETAEQPTALQEFSLKEGAFGGLAFTSLPAIDLHTFSPHIYPSGIKFWPLLAEISLSAPQTESILRAVADEASVAFFTGRTSRVIIAPYDGGVDIILPNTAMRDQYREKYSTWLSNEATGL